MIGAVPLVARDTIDALAYHGIRHTVVAASGVEVTVRFDIDAFDALGVALDVSDPEFDIDVDVDQRIAEVIAESAQDHADAETLKKVWGIVEEAMVRSSTARRIAALRMGEP